MRAHVTLIWELNVDFCTFYRWWFLWVVMKWCLLQSMVLESPPWLVGHHRPGSKVCWWGCVWHVPRGACLPSDLCSLSKFWVPWGWFHTAEGVLTPPTKGHCPIMWDYCLKRVEPFWLRIYNWSTAWPITFKEIMSFGNYYVTLGHVLLITLVNFTVSSLHPTRKGQLKLIVVRIWFPVGSPDLPSRFITMSICVSSQRLI